MSKDRRNFLKSTAVAGTAGLIAAAMGQPVARAAMGRGTDAVSIRTDGTYDVVPLQKPSVRLGVVQSRVRGVRIDHLREDRHANLSHMLEQIDNTFHFGAGADVLLIFAIRDRGKILQIVFDKIGRLLRSNPGHFPAADSVQQIAGLE